MERKELHKLNVA